MELGSTGVGLSRMACSIALCVTSNAPVERDMKFLGRPVVCWSLTANSLVQSPLER